ncbi:TIGR02285 family protein [Pseudomonas sp. NPDC096917]|uniref:TIGR02285 family protein n=1 Tax=Pseudomonas sp. NPDC096917 TaxID=3364483 RepID=UPI00383A1ECF
MTSRWTRRGMWAGLITSALLFWASDTLAAEKLIWLVRDLPPLTMHEGPQKGQGIIDQLLPVLIANMPQYQHVIMRVNRARSMQILEGSQLSCDPMLVWTPDRALRIAYSNPIIGLHSNGLVIRRKDEPMIAPFVHGKSIDLQAMLNSQSVKLGLVAKRSYGTWIDAQLSHGPASQFFIHYGNDALGSLLQMQQAGRLQSLLGYWPEIQAKAKQHGVSSTALVFYPIQGAPPYQPIYVGCSKTPQGQQVISSINTVLGNLAHTPQAPSQTDWIEPGQTAEEQVPDAPAP